MHGSPMSKKPFTYTPGGLDLSHIRESARVKRYESMSDSHSNTLTRKTSQSSYNQQNSYSSSNMNDQYSQNQFQSSFTNSSSSFMNSTASPSHSIYAVPATSSLPSFAPPPAPVNRPPPIKINNPPPTPTFNSMPSTPKMNRPAYQPPATPTGGAGGGFNITPDQLVKPSKNKDENVNM